MGFSTKTSDMGNAMQCYSKTLEKAEALLRRIDFDFQESRKEFDAIIEEAAVEFLETSIQIYTNALKAYKFICEKTPVFTPEYVKGEDWSDEESAKNSESNRVRKLHLRSFYLLLINHLNNRGFKVTEVKPFFDSDGFSIIVSWNPEK